MRILVDVDPHIRGEQRISFKERRDVRLHTEIIRVDAGEQMIHRRVGSHAHTVDPVFWETDALAHLMDHGIDGLLDHRVLQLLLAARFGRLDNTVDNVGSITDLSVTGRALRQDLSRLHVDQHSGYCSGTDIHRKSADHHVFSAVKNIIYEHIVRCCPKHTFHRKLTVSENIRKLSENRIGDSHTLQVHKLAQRARKPFDVRHGIVQSRFFHPNLHHVKAVFQFNTRQFDLSLGVFKNGDFFS